MILYRVGENKYRNLFLLGGLQFQYFFWVYQRGKEIEESIREQLERVCLVIRESSIFLFDWEKRGDVIEL